MKMNALSLPGRTPRNWNGLQPLEGEVASGGSAARGSFARTASGRTLMLQKEPPPAPPSGEEIHQALDQLLMEAQNERLEGAMPLIRLMQKSLAVELATRNVPPGTLTVAGWLGLLNRWEEALKQIRKRQIFFAKPFFVDAAERFRRGESPLTSLLDELLELMDHALIIE
ncbi:MAG: hypothetical protein HQL51_02880 [Magnetococcales bacterium]|nr:hypothetical protein [Magnetococcales bacterium]